MGSPTSETKETVKFLLAKGDLQMGAITEDVFVETAMEILEGVETFLRDAPLPTLKNRLNELDHHCFSKEQLSLRVFSMGGCRSESDYVYLFYMTEIGYIAIYKSHLSDEDDQSIEYTAAANREETLRRIFRMYTDAWEYKPDVTHMNMEPLHRFMTEIDKTLNGFHKSAKKNAKASKVTRKPIRKLLKRHGEGQFATT